MTEKWNRCDKHKFQYPDGGYCPACSDKPPLRIVQITPMGEHNDELTALTNDGRLLHGYWRLQGDFCWAAELTPNEDELNRLPNISKYRESEENQND